MTRRVGVLGAGFGGLELSTILSEALGDHLDLTLGREPRCNDRLPSWLLGGW